MDRAEKALEYFKEGYNCAQAVVLAYADKMKMDEKSAAMISAPFGGGMGRMREVCGAVSGMFMVFGAQKGTSDPKDKQGKEAMYRIVQKIAAEFEEENGSIVCGRLLGIKGKDDPKPSERDEKYYKKRPCGEYVACAARIVEKYINDAE